MPEDMMKATSHTYCNVTSTVYRMNAGEKIKRHKHEIPHTTGVISGSTEVEIWGDDPKVFKMNVGDEDYVLPPYIDHEVRALEDETFVIHIVEGKNNVYKTISYVDESIPLNGGVMLVDGTIIY